MNARAVFPAAPAGAGMYESFYLRAVSPADPLGVWLRYTVHKRPGSAPRGSIWCTVFDRSRGAPFMHKASSSELSVRPGEWIGIGDQAMLGPETAEGSCGGARWSLRFRSAAPELRHLRPELLYRAPLPRTKLTSPAPLAHFDGVLELPGRPAIELSDWVGMVGHNWGSEHAERWIWLHGCDFAGSSESWLDLAAGRILLAGRMTPWVVNGALSIDGETRALGGLLAARPTVSESTEGVTIAVAARRGPSVELQASAPPGTAAGWRYADPDGGEHDVVNCSIAKLRVSIGVAARQPSRVLETEHGGAYELGMRAGAGEPEHDVPIAPFIDG